MTSLKRPEQSRVFHTFFRRRSDLPHVRWHGTSRHPLLSELLENPELVGKLLERREASRIHHRVVGRLEHSTIRMSHVEVELIERLPSDHEDQ